MKRIIVAATTAALVIGLATVGTAPATAAPPTAPWGGSAGSDVAEVGIDALGVDLVGIGVAASDALTGSTVTPRSDATSSNLRAEIVGLPIDVAFNRQFAPPDNAAPAVGALAAASTPLLNIGALTTTDEANWDGDNACVTTGPLARATTETVGIEVLPDFLFGGDVVALGVSRSEGETGLVQNTGVNYGVRSTASGTVSQIRLLGGAVLVDVLGTTTLTATAPGSAPGSVDFVPGNVTVTVDGVQTPLTEADSEFNVDLAGVGEVTVRLNLDPTITSLSPTSVAATASLLTIEVAVPDVLPILPPLAAVSVDILPLQASATAPATGIDCPPPAPVIITPAEGATTGPQPTITGTAEPGATVEVFVDGTSIGTTTATGGNWSIVQPSALANGPHAATAIQTVAGQASPASPPRNFIVDAVAPAPPVIVAPANGSVTGDNTPNVTGTAEANSTVNVIIDGVPAGSTTADPLGNWTFTPTTPLSDGPHSAVATSTDAVGNTSGNSNTVNFTVDTAIPAPPVIVTPANGSITGDNTPPVTGTAEANSTVNVTIDGTPAGSTTADPLGNWTFTPTTPLIDGPHSAVATSTDAGGNTSGNSNTVNFTVDTTAPPAPVVVAPANGSVTSDTTPPVTGTAEANTTVTVIIDGNPIGLTPVDTFGNWSTTSPVLTEGVHTVRALATDAAGNVSPSSATNTFTVDTLAPTPPVILTPVTGTLTSDNTPDITGTAEANSLVTVRINGVIAGTTTAGPTGDWIFTPTTPLPDGSHSAVATSTDAAGNVSADSNTVAFVVDTTPPAAPVVVTPANGSVTGDNTPNVAGTSVPNTTVTVRIDGVVAGTAPAGPTGNWTFTPTIPLADGSHTAVATATDLAGNVSPDSNTNTFTVDTTAPLPPVILTPVTGTVTSDSTPDITGTAEANSLVTVWIDGVVAGTTTAGPTGNWTFTSGLLLDGPHTAVATSTDVAGNVSGNSNTVTFTVDTLDPAPPVIVTPANGSVTGDNTPNVTGTAEANSTVNVIIDGTPAGSTTADPLGNWTFTPTTPLSDGPHSAVATSTDAAGNTSGNSNTVTFTVDTAAPVPPVIVTPATGTVTADNTPTFTGTAEGGSTVTVIIDGIPAGSTTADPLGNWTFTPTTPLTDGPHNAVATSTDAGGNTSGNSNAVAFVVDTTAPLPPVILTPVTGTVTSDSTPDITGTAEANSTVTVRIDGVIAGTTTAGPTGDWTFTPAAPLSEGSHTAVATSTDAAGNVSPDSNAVTFTVDALPPLVPVVITPADGSVTNDTTPLITGTGEPNTTLTITMDDAPIGTTEVDGDGNWSMTSPVLAEGMHSVRADSVDVVIVPLAPSNTNTFEVDLTAPAAPIITSPTNGSTTTDSTPPITGTAEPGSTVTVVVDGTPIGTAPTDGNGNWTFTPTTPLPNGQHTITATATDAAGNTGPASTPVVFTIAATGAGGGGLPATGGTTPWLGLVIGSLLVAVGAMALTVRRRRVSA